MRKGWQTFRLSRHCRYLRTSESKRLIASGCQHYLMPTGVLKKRSDTSINLNPWSRFRYRGLCWTRLLLIAQGRKRLCLNYFLLHSAHSYSSLAGFWMAWYKDAKEMKGRCKTPLAWWPLPNHVATTKNQTTVEPMMTKMLTPKKGGTT